MRAAILLVLCACLAPLLAGDPIDLPEANLTVTPAFGWLRTPGKEPNRLDFRTRDGEQFIIIANPEGLDVAGAFAWLLEHLGERTEDLIASEPRRMPVLGEDDAPYVVYTYRSQGRRFALAQTAVNRLGIGYELRAISAAGDAERATTDLRRLAAALRLSGDRPEWRARLRGLPMPIPLLGGTASFILPQPRWSESSFTDARHRSQFERLHLDHASRQAWCYAEASPDHPSLEAAIRSLRDRLLGAKPDDQVRQVMLRSASAAVAVTEIRRRHEASPRIYLLGGRSEGRLHAVLLFELLVQHEGELTPEIADAFASIRFAGPEDGRLAYPLPAAGPGDGALDRLLADGGWRDVVPRNEHVILAPSGRWLGIPDRAEFALRPLDGAAASRLLTLDPPGEPIAALSGDARRLAYLAEDEAQIVVRSTDAAVDRQQRLIPGRAGSLAFAGSRLYAIRPGATSAADPLGTFAAQRVVELLADGRERLLLTYPLARFSMLTASPDGDRLAVIGNRDLPRTAESGGQALIIPLDGPLDPASLRPLTPPTWHVSALGWTADRRLLALVATQVDQQGRHLPHAAGGIVRLDPAGGPAEVLIAQPSVMEMAAAGGTVLAAFRPEAWLPRYHAYFATQVDRLAPLAATLAASVHGVPPGLERRLQSTLGATRPADAVPTPELMARLADALVPAVRAELGIDLDGDDDEQGRFARLLGRLKLDAGDRVSATLLACAAYHGETLRRSGSAAWAIAPQRVGDGLPGLPDYDRRVVGTMVITPFESILRSAYNDDQVGWFSIAELRRRGARAVLAYPAAHAPQALLAHADAEDLAAGALLDRGELAGALAAYDRLLVRRRSTAVAEQAARIASALGLGASAAHYQHLALAGGSQDEPLAMAHAEVLAARGDRAGAIAVLHRALGQSRPSAELYLAAGRHWEALGRTDLAASCWRRAQQRAPTDAQAAIVRAEATAALDRHVLRLARTIPASPATAAPAAPAAEPVP